MQRAEFDDHPIWRVELRDFVIRMRNQVEHNAGGTWSGLGDPDPANQAVANLMGGVTVLTDPGPRVEEIEVQAVRIFRVIGLEFEWAGCLNNDSCGIRVGPGTYSCNLNYAGIRCGNHWQG
jgi:hypothetical protein